MPLRLFAALLAMMLCWSSLSTHEQAYAHGFGAPTLAADAPGRSGTGSVEQHHLDDIPSQGHNHAMGEAPARVTALPEAEAARFALPAYRAAGHGDPALPPPQRPPRA